MSRAVELSFQLSREDWKAFLKVVSRRVTVIAKAKQKLFVSNLLVWIPLGYAAATVVAMYRKYPFASDDLTALSVSIVLGAVAFVAHLIYKQHLTQKAAISDSGNFASTQRVRIDDAGIAVWSRFGDARYVWDSFASRVEDDGRIYLFIDNAAAVIIPKAVIATAEDLADIRRWTENIPTN